MGKNIHKTEDKYEKPWSQRDMTGVQKVSETVQWGPVYFTGHQTVKREATKNKNFVISRSTVRWHVGKSYSGIW